MTISLIRALALIALAPLLVPPDAHGAAFQPTRENKNRPSATPPPGMVWIPGGEFSMGSDETDKEVCGLASAAADAQPVHQVYVDGFWMDATEVTNEQFARFVAATHYVTVAERQPNAADYPGVPKELLVPGSLVFAPPDHPVPLNNPARWWTFAAGADWRHPEGPDSNIAGKQKFPVVQIAYEDAAAYAAWAGKRLPTEAEWEFAARGGLSGKRYPWGDELRPHGRWMANIFEGNFPDHNSSADGFTGAAPVGSFAPNNYGLHDMAGNVWEWCSDWYRPDTYVRQLEAAKGALLHNPTGPTRQESYDPAEPGVAKRVQRGGSFLCTAQYCNRYVVGTRGKGSPDTGSNHLGFRCVKTP